jgi:hypothetical protein
MRACITLDYGFLLFFHLYLNFAIMKPVPLAVLSIAVMTIMSCNHSAEFASQNDKKIDINGLVSTSDQEQQGGSLDSVIQTSKTSQTIPIPPKVDWDRKIVKTANLNLEVKDFNAFYRFLKTSVSNAGGYVAQESQSQDEYKIMNTVSIKVPVDQFDNVLTVLLDGAKVIKEKTVNSADVTGQIIDTKSRLEAKKQVRLKYLELLQQAHKMEDILTVQTEINEIQENIEAANGQLASLGHSAAFSTINATYFQVLNASAKVDNGKPSFGREVSDAFSGGWNWLAGVFIALLNIWPIVLILTFFGIMINRRLSAKPKTKAVV